MKSYLTAGFRLCFSRLPDHVKNTARKNYRLWRSEPSHPGLAFKKVGNRTESYAVRIGIGWRALGVKEDNVMIWFWIGSHAEYDNLIRNL